MWGLCEDHQDPLKISQDPWRTYCTFKHRWCLLKNVQFALQDVPALSTKTVSSPCFLPHLVLSNVWSLFWVSLCPLLSSFSNHWFSLSLQSPWVLILSSTYRFSPEPLFSVCFVLLFLLQRLRLCVLNSCTRCPIHELVIQQYLLLLSRVLSQFWHFQDLRLIYLLSKPSMFQIHQQ